MAVIAAAAVMTAACNPNASADTNAGPQSSASASAPASASGAPTVSGSAAISASPSPSASESAATGALPIPIAGRSGRGTGPARTDEIPDYLTTGLGNSFISNAPNAKHVQDYIEAAEVDADGNVWTTSEWDEAHNECGKYFNGDVEMHNTVTCKAVNNTQVTAGGIEWTLKDGQVTGGGKTVPGIVRATALGLDRPNNQLMVGDDGVGEHIVKFFSVTGGEPKLTRTLGQKGGIRAGTPGEVQPDKFWGITGTGADAKGNLYVTGSQGGVYIRSFTPDGKTLNWELNQWHFTDAGECAPETQCSEFYGAGEIYSFDPSIKDINKQWGLKAYTVDLDKYPKDPRANSDQSVRYRVLGGKKFLLSSYMNLGDIHVYGFEDTGYIAHEVKTLKADDLGGGSAYLTIAPNGDIIRSGCNALEISKFDKLDGDGLPVWKPFETVKVPAPFTCVMSSYYLPDQDVMYLGGGTADKATEGWGNGGPVVARYSNWSTNPTKDWEITVPWRHNEGPVPDRLVPISFAAAGDYLFITYVNRDGDYTVADGESGVTRVYNGKDGKFVGRMLPDGPSTDKGASIQGSWVDIMSFGTSAFERSDGYYYLCREDNWLGKQICYIWKP